MKLPVSWLKELVKTNLSAKKIADVLTMQGLEVESIEGRADFDKVVIGEILAVEKHPNADKLHLTKVNIGLKDPLMIVCGANNLSVGIKVPVVLIGGHVAGFEIKKANLRGVESNGMICSEKELGLGEDHTGIMILDQKAKVGESFTNYVSADEVIDASIPANRPDCMSIIGLAREVAAGLNEKLDKPKVGIKENQSEKTADLINIEILDKDLCSRYIGRVAKNVRIGPSPDWLVKRLMAAGVRPINNVVDISNYVMLETGQPLHFFDLSKLAKEGKKTKIIVRRAKKGETIETLDGQKRELDQEMLVIADPKGAVAVAGVMGGASSEVDVTTKDILIEAAVFDKASIRKTAHKLGLRSEAVARFEKGTPERLPEYSIARSVQLLAELAEGQITAGQVDVLSKWIWIQHIGLSKNRLKKFLNINISEKETFEILKDLGYQAEQFDIATEAKKHLGQPYLYGANFKENGTNVFDCSYLTDYIYSLIDTQIGHTSLAQLHHGWEVKEKDFRPGDVLFYKGHIENSATDKYYVKDENGNHQKVKTDKYPDGVGHNGIYIGHNQVIHAVAYEYKNGKWFKKDKKDQKVEMVPLEYFTKNPEFLGARRYVENLADVVAITVPWWREDVRTDADIYEEIARIYGYDKIPSTLPDMRDLLPVKNDDYKFTQDIRHLLADLGLTEILTYPFVSKKELEAVGEDTVKALKVANPLVKEQELLRTTLAPSMLKALCDNQYNQEVIQFFEIGKTFGSNKKSQLPKEARSLSIGIKTDAGGKQGFGLAKGILDRILANYKISRLELVPAKDAKYEPGQAGKNAYIEIGLISENVAKKFDLKKKVVLLQIDLESLQKLAAKGLVFKAINKYPSVTRDISALFEAKITVKSVLDSLEKIDPLIKKSEIIDIYEGKSLKQTEKSISIRFTLWSDKSTLIEADVEKAILKCKSMIKKLGGKIRGGQE